MPRINLFLKVTLNILVWIFLYLLSYIFTRNFTNDFDHVFQLLITTVYAVVFYLNYYFLMPFFYKRKFLVYIGLSLLLLSGAFIVKHAVFITRIEKRFSERKEIRGEEPFRFPGEFKEPKPEFRKPGLFAGRGLLHTSSGLLLFFAFSFSMRFIQKWQDDERHKSELEKEKITTELSFLKQQINPHFLFNSLNSIYSLSISKSDITTNSILKLSSILRYMLYESEDSFVSLKDEIRTIQDYIDLQKLRLTDMVELNLRIDGDSDNYKIAPFVLIPLIENAFKHGVDNIKESFINIILKIKESKLIMEVSNNIVFDASKNSKNSGIGLKNIERRLEILYPDEYVFEKTNQQGVFKVYLELNLRT